MYTYTISRIELVPIIHLGFSTVSVDGADSKSCLWESKGNLGEDQITACPWKKKQNKLLHEMTEKKFVLSTTTANIILETMAVGNKNFSCFFVLFFSIKV